jgi:hypothetical protein
MTNPVPSAATRPSLASGSELLYRRISPTDISQFIRLEQCQRYLALRLKERVEGRRFMYDYGVAPQSIPPLLTRAGASFEQAIETALAQAGFQVCNLGQEAGKHPPDNARILDTIRTLTPGQVICFFQARLVVTLNEWELRGDLDILRLERDLDGKLSILIVDMKSSTNPKVEHRLQVAFYQAMLTELLQKAGVAYETLDTGVLYRGAAEAEAGLDPKAAQQLLTHRDAAQRYFGLETGLLEIVEKQADYLEAVEDLVTGPDSVTAQVAAMPLSESSYHLTNKCSGCLYNEHCLKWSAGGGRLILATPSNRPG